LIDENAIKKAVQDALAKEESALKKAIQDTVATTDKVKDSVKGALRKKCRRVWQLESLPRWLPDW